jgi:hypothetical protein
VEGIDDFKSNFSDPKMTMEFVGSTTIPAQISQMRFTLPLGGKRYTLPMKQMPHQKETVEIKTAKAIVP